MQFNSFVAHVLSLQAQAESLANNKALHRRTADALVISVTNSVFLTMLTCISISWIAYVLLVGRAARNLVASQGMTDVDVRKS